MKNRPDYDFSKHVKIPDEWIEKALAVPSVPAGESRGFSLRSRRLAAAAGVVLVLGLSISIYFLIRKMSDASDVVAPRRDQTATVPTESSPVPTETADAYAPTGTEPNAPIPTEAPSQTPTQPVPTEPTALPTEPAVTPTVQQTDAPVEPPTQPATAPVVIPTEPATAPPEPSTVPPTEPNIPPPTDDPIPAAECDVEVLIPFALPIYQTSESDAEETIYCRIYNEAGALVGESDWYAPSHIAQMLWVDRTPYLYYTQSLPANAYTAAAGQYQYVFYDSAGKTLQYGYC